MHEKTDKNLSTLSSAAALFFAALPKGARGAGVRAAAGRALAEPIFVSVDHEDGTAQIDAGAIFRETLKAGGGGNRRCAQPSIRRHDAK